MVLFTITDAFIRRNQGQERVIGTLLGSISDGVVEVKNCYAVPHSESNEQVGAAAAGGWGGQAALRSLALWPGLAGLPFDGADWEAAAVGADSPLHRAHVAQPRAAAVAFPLGAATQTF